MGLFFFVLGFLSLTGVDLVGWAVYPTKWVVNPVATIAKVPKKGKKPHYGAIGKPGKAFYALGKKYGTKDKKDKEGNLIKGSKSFYKDLGWWSIIWTYIILSIVTFTGAVAMGWDRKKFFIGWTIIYFMTIAVWFIGHHAFFAASTKPVKALVDGKEQAMKQYQLYGLPFSLSLGGGASFILALIVGLVIGNFFKKFAKYLGEAAKPEWFIKTAIVYLGVKVGYLAIKGTLIGEKLGAKLGKELGGKMKDLTLDLFLAGAVATIVAYLIFWPVVYTVARKLFKLPRKTAAVLGSGISICGVSAAVATGGAVRAKPVVTIMVSALVVVWAVIELMVLPVFFTNVYPTTKDPLVAGAAMGMSVKTDGADAAAGELMDELMRIKIETDSGGTIKWPEGIITTSTVMTKVWIDMFIGLWAFVLALVWVYRIDKRQGETVPLSEVWFRFPKFVIGYFICWFVYLGVFFVAGGGDPGPEGIHTFKLAKVGAIPVEKGLRKLFFMLTFMSLGIITDFKKLAEAKFGRMVWVYFVSLFVFIIPIALLIAYLFHHGMTIPNIAR